MKQPMMLKKRNRLGKMTKRLRTVMSYKCLGNHLISAFACRLTCAGRLHRQLSTIQPLNSVWENVALVLACLLDTSVCRYARVGQKIPPRQS